jgi:hypothetical protein
VRRATHPDPDRRLVAQFGGHHSLGIVKERDERLGSLPGVVGIVVKPRFYLQAEGDASDTGRGSAYLDEELDLAANADEIQVGVEAEDVDAAAGATGVEVSKMTVYLSASAGSDLRS